MHIPYCRRACAYCDFHFTTARRGMTDMVKAMKAEMRLRSTAWQGESMDTLYIGGGTPSLLRADALEGLLLEARKCFDLRGEKECTIEANPEDINKSSLLSWRSMGITRVSIGVQSFHSSRLARMGRYHEASLGEKAIVLSYAHGYKGNISIDLIYGSEESSEAWAKDLDMAEKLEVPHISAYSLCVEPNTALHRWVKQGKARLVGESFVGEQMGMVQAWGRSLGYVQYEVSAFAKGKKEGLHNKNYWLGGSYVGIGPSAHSYDHRRGRRGFNVRSNGQYIRSLLSGGFVMNEEEVLSFSQRWMEYVMLRMRTRWGIRRSDIGQFLSQRLADAWWSRAGELVSRGLLCFDGDRVYASEKGMRLVDGVVSFLLG